ncbi:uncharacterized protein [Oryza sativa Japonica Group]|uniref:DUF4220 domain-containing protein n=3 Tax=Oryza sativa subsp. japonica TaxID=39947 RepID=B9FR88_ORYSJ|nr:uncharacterized protein LOC9268194 [Oryza sativa Japonica Group]EEE64999.1 hypothetical protein OsJ_19935 [Oryza sativa Japonica Group]BAD68385.1 hypothetical protein [Oryza sativa Japonica Group]BAS95885.1 Os06g0121200 [Oryza sativa Japonica Group]
MENNVTMDEHVCPQKMVAFVYNMTSPYGGDNSKETSVVAISALTFFLAAAFFDLNLFSRLSRVSAVLNPTVRLLLAASLNLFLPVMSYLFSEAKMNGGATAGSNNCKKTAKKVAADELSLLARVILIWMLLVELLRKKLEGALVITRGTQGYSNIVTHAASVVWMGNLVFFTVKAPGKKAMFGILWVLCAAKLVQRVVINEMARRSSGHGKNPRLISSYMAATTPIPTDMAGAAALERCRYAVMGEENMVVKAGPRGYELDLDVAETDEVLTVGKIWRTREHPKLKRLCLSFALFKLLRRRLEDVPPMTKREAQECRTIIFDGLGSNATAAGDLAPEVTVFQVLKDELNLFTEYYHSVLPVVLASPYFFFVNYVLYPPVVFALCLMTIVLCGNGGIPYVINAMLTDSSFLSVGVGTMAKCLWSAVARSSRAFYTFIDVFICYILFIAVAYEEATETLVFLISDWFAVSLLHAYYGKATPPAAARFVLKLSRNLRHYPSRITMKQFSVLGCSSDVSTLPLPTAKLPKHTKRSILERFRDARPPQDGGGGAAVPLSKNSPAALSTEPFSRFAWACQGGGGGGVAEIILVWHIATTLLEAHHGPPHPTEHVAEERRSRKTAARLSRYCAYLVAFQPELLPDNKEGTQLVYGDVMNEQMKVAVGAGQLGYHVYLTSEWGRLDAVRKIADRLTATEIHRDSSAAAYASLTVLEKGAVLGKLLVEEADGDDKAAAGGRAAVWEMVAGVWVELVAYMAPSSVEEHARAHEAGLVKGIEVITMLWALATHTGIARPDDEVPVEGSV